MHHKTYETNRFFDNWFVNIAGGINVYEGEYDHKVTWGNRLSPALDISVGKWITPAYGVRLQCAGLQAKGLTTTSRSAFLAFSNSVIRCCTFESNSSF